MPPYERPPIADVVVRAEDGQVIPYGDRWEDGPPDETYSVVSHLERFAPLHTIADALVAHLAATYDVEVTEGPNVVAAVVAERAAERCSAPLGQPEEDFLARVVRVAPRGGRGAMITFVWTTFPGVLLHVHDAPRAVRTEGFPSCGCDACDETWHGVGEALEDEVLGVVTGTSLAAQYEAWPLRTEGP